MKRNRNKNRLSDHMTMKMNRFNRDLCAFYQLPPKMIFGDEAIRKMRGKYELPSKLTDEQMAHLKAYNDHIVKRYWSPSRIEAIIGSLEEGKSQITKEEQQKIRQAHLDAPHPMPIGLDSYEMRRKLAEQKDVVQ